MKQWSELNQLSTVIWNEWCWIFTFYYKWVHCVARIKLMLFVFTCLKNEKWMSGILRGLHKYCTLCSVEIEKCCLWQHKIWGVVCCKCTADYSLQKARVRMSTEFGYMLQAMLVGRMGSVTAVLITYKCV